MSKKSQNREITHSAFIYSVCSCVVRFSIKKKTCTISSNILVKGHQMFNVQGMVLSTNNHHCKRTGSEWSSKFILLSSWTNALFIVKDNSPSLYKLVSTHFSCQIHYHNKILSIQLTKNDFKVILMWWKTLW